MTVKRQKLNRAVKALAHPVRTEIVKQLKRIPVMTPVELAEQIDGQDRYNIIHHLKVLRDAGIVGAEESNGRAVRYKLLEVKDPAMAREAVLIFDEKDIKTRAAEFRELIDTMSDMEGEEIPKKNKISRVEIVIHYM